MAKARFGVSGDIFKELADDIRKDVWAEMGDLVGRLRKRSTSEKLYDSLDLDIWLYGVAIKKIDAEGNESRVDPRDVWINPSDTPPSSRD